MPEQHTDFIFTVVGEELGFVGAGRSCSCTPCSHGASGASAQWPRDLFGMLVCAGALSMLVFQVFENIGMTTGIMPITGIPLPLLSYGGSSTVAFFVAIGLVVNVHMRRFSIIVAALRCASSPPRRRLAEALPRSQLDLART